MKVRDCGEPRGIPRACLKEALRFPVVMRAQSFKARTQMLE